MSDYVAVMNQGHFEQLDTPQNLYSNPATSFVAQFVGENNKMAGKLDRDGSGLFFITLEGGIRLVVARPSALQVGEQVEVFVRPEAMSINPGPTPDGVNKVAVVVKAVLFDGGNSGLLCVIEGSSKELIVKLPQAVPYEVKAHDRICVAWDPARAVCFRSAGVKTYDDL